MLRIAITGGIATGKSLLGRLIERSGVAVCEADCLAHELLMPGTEVAERVVREFGRNILDYKGAIERAKLAEIVFADQTQLLRLNRIIHPEVRRMWEKWLGDQAEAAPASCMACVIVPLLFEANCADEWDAVVCVRASRELQRTRLTEKGVPQQEIRIAMQMPDEIKADRSDFVVVNSGSAELLAKQWNMIYQSIMEKQA